VRRAAFALLRLRDVISHLRRGAVAMDSYEFAYFGRDFQSLANTIASWCMQRKCCLETTELNEGATFRISGPDDTVREAMQMVRVWMHRSR
jgi:hypothetical protein